MNDIWNAPMNSPDDNATPYDQKHASKRNPRSEVQSL